jgi:hypothetical protein
MSVPEDKNLRVYNSRARLLNSCESKGRVRLFDALCESTTTSTQTIFADLNDE